MATEELLKILNEENQGLKDLLLSIDCGEISASTLPMNQEFYATKKARIEALIWILEVEQRILSSASNRNTEA